MTDLWGIGLLQNNFINTLCEIRSTRQMHNKAMEAEGEDVLSNDHYYTDASILLEIRSVFVWISPSISLGITSDEIIYYL